MSTVSHCVSVSSNVLTFVLALGNISHLHIELRQGRTLNP